MSPSPRRLWRGLRGTPDPEQAVQAGPAAEVASPPLTVPGWTGSYWPGLASVAGTATLTAPGTTYFPMLYAGGTVSPGNSSASSATSLPGYYYHYTGNRPVYPLALPAPVPVPEEEQEELITGTKYAVLCIDRNGKPCFRGTAGLSGGMYYAESYAKCSYEPGHQAPQANCSCGFWVPCKKESALASWTSDRVQLEVELAGRVAICSQGSADDPWGYRAQWQRVMSVTLPAACHIGDRYTGNCDGSPKYLCRGGGTFRVASLTGGDDYCIVGTACDAHVDRTALIDKPVSWLRQGLQTEVRPGTVTDAPPEPLPQLEDAGKLEKQYRDEVARIVGKMTRVSQLELPAVVTIGYGATARVHDVVHDTVTYQFKATPRGWELYRITSAEMDRLERLIASVQGIQAKLESGQITLAEARRQLG